MSEGLGLKGARKPTETKRKIDLEEWSPVGSVLKVPNKLIKIADEQGIEYRWLSATMLSKNQGYHPRGWKVFPINDFCDPEADLGLGTFHIGKTPDGTLRRGSMVLGYKPKEAGDVHRKVLKERADAMASFQERKADQLRQVARDHGGKAQVVVGYEDNK